VISEDRSASRQARRALVEDLVNGTCGTDDATAYGRAEALGHNLHGRHRVVLAEQPGHSVNGALSTAVERAAASLGMGSLLATRAGMVILLAHRPGESAGSQAWTELHGAVREQLPSLVVSVGVGGNRERPGDLAHSWQEALRALVIRRDSKVPDGVTLCDKSGLVVLPGAGNPDIGLFVTKWLGRLLAYDVDHEFDLVGTLAVYLDSDSSLDRAAERLGIHRSVLRYRIWQVRELSGHDLTDAENQLNLRMAIWAWRTEGGLRRAFHDE
jgi:sugar diacid utilization regulator